MILQGADEMDVRWLEGGEEGDPHHLILNLMSNRDLILGVRVVVEKSALVSHDHIDGS